MKKSLVAFGAMAAATVATLFTMRQYRLWQEEEIERLEAGSHVVKTPLGLVEYSVLGEGPTVLIAHGSPGGYDQSMAIARFLNDSRFSFICMSRPGYLRTPLATGQTPEEQADMYAALLNTLGIQRAAITGISGGGSSALQFALRHPDRCNGLIMLSALAQHYSEDEVNQLLPLPTRLLKMLNDRLLLFNPFVFVLVKLSEAMPQVIAPDFVHSLAMSNLRLTGYDNDMEQFGKITGYPLERVGVPTLALHGTADIDLPIAHAEQVEAKVPGARLIRAEGGGHLFFGNEAYSDMALTAMREFLESLA
ncbi:MAG TPA: alpha/beta hydrolase [Ktedonobacteraceae bacterium]|nr:alpha/beta hydrolase [Ktedonobacteraceae bacterium]